MTHFSRADRVSQLIQRELSEILQKETKDPRLKMTTVTAVKMSKDLKNAKVYFSNAGADRNIDDAFKGFQSALGHIKRTLASRLDLRYMPDLRFFYDESFDYGARIDKLLKSIANDTDGSDHRPVESE